jgi:uncharacterized protein YegP (UPF0339 family)
MANKGTLYEATDGFRWQLRAGNGRIIAESGEAYTTAKKAQDAYAKVFGGQYSLHDDDTGEELVPAGGEPVTAGVTAGASSPSGHNTAFDALPNDPNHPLYSPRSIDGNK